MKVHELKTKVAGISTALDHLDVEIWIPGSKIYLSGTPFLSKDCVLIEGNVKSGSALDDSIPTLGGRITYRWERVAKACFVDVPGTGRYLIRRGYKGAHHFRAFLNSDRTEFTADTMEQVADMVERSIRVKAKVDVTFMRWVP